MRTRTWDGGTQNSPNQAKDKGYSTSPMRVTGQVPHLLDNQGWLAGADRGRDQQEISAPCRHTGLRGEAFLRPWPEFLRRLAPYQTGNLARPAFFARFTYALIPTSLKATKQHQRHFAVVCSVMKGTRWRQFVSLDHHVLGEDQASLEFALLDLCFDGKAPSRCCIRDAVSQPCILF